MDPFPGTCSNHSANLNRLLTDAVVVKHQGKKYDVELDPSSNGETFKFQLYSLTGVEPERQKILVKGGQLKDETDMSKLGLKPGQLLMMMGTSSTSGVVVEKPKQKPRFLEDMTAAEAAQVEGAIPAGLDNLGNTCYLNSAIQTLRSISELGEEIMNYNTPREATNDIGMSIDLTPSLRQLFQSMSRTQESRAPFAFLNALRQAFPNFAQRTRDGHSYAQQDAEEAWSQIITRLRIKLKTTSTDAEGNEKEVSLVDKYMAGEFESLMECDEPAAKDAGEEAVKSTESFLKLSCHINADTNHLRDGLAKGLVTKMEKRSEILGRDAMFTKTSKISRLPKYLTVHFLRFDWRRSTNKKAKIMRKVTFPKELDVVEFCTEDLAEKLVPIRNKFRDYRGIMEDVKRARKRQRRNREDADRALPAEEGARSNKKDAKKKDSEDVEMEGVVFKTEAEIEAEQDLSILTAKKELMAMLDDKQKADVSTNHTGLYELRGIITHQGATADSGHYTAFVKKAPVKDPITEKYKEDGKWWWFNDDKVSEFDEDRIETLSGGGKSI
jgi:ubiquitin carboxyl-terminal hydrolase 14